MLEKFKDIICEYVEVEKDLISEDKRFVEDLGFNSYDFMCMLGECEEEFNIRIDEKEIINIVYVREALEYIEIKMAA